MVTSGDSLKNEGSLPSDSSGQSASRLGVMGGAFDPIHVAHLFAAEEARLQFELGEVLFMPAGDPPHKTRSLAPAEFRYQLVSAATASHPRFSVSRFEIDSPGVTYTVDTLEHLREVMAPGTSIYFITGADAVLEILTWKDPVRVLELATFIAATRPGYDLSRLKGLMKELRAQPHGAAADPRVVIMEIPALAISSSMIRERIANGKGARYLVPDSVLHMIEGSGVYS